MGINIFAPVFLSLNNETVWLMSIFQLIYQLITLSLVVSIYCISTCLSNQKGGIKKNKINMAIASYQARTTFFTVVKDILLQVTNHVH